MRGGLRWLYRPFQVLCVLVAVLLAAAFSLQSGIAEQAGRRPIPDKPDLGSLREVGKLQSAEQQQIHTPSGPAQSLEPAADEIEMLVKRGKDDLTNGDISSARLLLRRAAEAGSAEAALALGSTFDPAVVQRLGAIGVRVDRAKAREWYQKAAALGSKLASPQLGNLAEARR
jgi:TPR repeat protein